MFDPYHKWLGIPADQRPPSLYQLLGISPSEQDKEVIRESAIRQTNHLRAYQAGPNAETCAKLLNEIAQAQIVLSDPAKRKDYDAKFAISAKKPGATRAAFAGKVPAATSRTAALAKPRGRAAKKSGRGLVVMVVLALLVGGAAVAAWQFYPQLVGNNGVAVVRPTTAPATLPPSKPADTSAGEVRPETKPVPETKPIPETKPLPETRPEPKPTPDAKGIARTLPASADPKEPKSEQKPPLAKGERAGEIRTVGSKVAAKMPPPPAEAQAKDQTLVRELFKADYAKAKVADRQALAGKLLQQGLDTKDNPTSRFVLLREASTIAPQGHDATVAVGAIDELAKDFAVNALEMKVAALESLANAIPPNGPASKTQVDAAMQVIDDAVAADQYDLALRLLKAAEPLSRKTKNGALIAGVQTRNMEVGQMRKDHDAYLKARAVLAANPADPAGNATVGKYLCVHKGEWELGLPHLAACGLATLSELARKDLAFPTDAAERAKLGDSWWEAGDAETGIGKRRFHERAIYWYEGAVGSLTGLTKTVVEKRLAGVASRPEGLGTTLVFNSVKDLKEVAEPISADFWSIKDGKLTGGKDSFFWLKQPLGDPFWVRLAFTSGGTDQSLAFAPTATLEANESWLLEATPDNRLKIHLHKGAILGPKRTYPLTPGRHVLSARYGGDELRVFLDGQEQFAYRVDPELPQPLKLGLYTGTGDIAIDAMSFGSGKPAAIRSTPTVKLDPNAVVELFDENKGFVDVLRKGYVSGQVLLETKDVYSGSMAIRVARMGNGQLNTFGYPAGWDFKIVEKPANPGEFRYLRYAWKKVGGKAMMLQLLDNPSKPGGTFAAYVCDSGPLIPGLKSISAGRVPAQWTVVTRDLFKDFGPFVLRGIGFTPDDGEFGLFDHVYLGRSIEDLDRLSKKR